MVADEKPITKDEVQPENDLTKSYKDMMNRFDELGNNEENKFNA